LRAADRSGDLLRQSQTLANPPTRRPPGCDADVSCSPWGRSQVKLIRRDCAPAMCHCFRCILICSAFQPLWPWSCLSIPRIKVSLYVNVCSVCMPERLFSRAFRCQPTALRTCLVPRLWACPDCTTAPAAKQAATKPSAGSHPAEANKLAILGDQTQIVFPYPDDAGLSALVICNHAGLSERCYLPVSLSLAVARLLPFFQCCGRAFSRPWCGWLCMALYGLCMGSVWAHVWALYVLCMSTRMGSAWALHGLWAHVWAHVWALHGLFWRHYRVYLSVSHAR
jgi:hypothetical protein